MAPPPSHSPRAFSMYRALTQHQTHTA
jgi:hypothetical protein